MGKLFFLFCILSLGYNNISAQHKATASTSVTIITAVGTNKSAELDFGKFVSAGVASKISLSCDGLLTTNGNVKISDQNRCAAAMFKVSGDNSAYSISLSFDPLLIHTADKKESMKIDLYRIQLPSQGNLNNDRMETIALGADLEIGATQLAGKYKSNNPYYLTVNFN